MKKSIRTMIAAIICAVITITAITTDTAYAADKAPLKVTFNKKSVTLTEDINDGIKKINVKKLKKKWGSPTTEENEDCTIYTWKKGKTEIRYMTGRHENIYINLENKNESMFGIKVGMKQAKASKIMQSLGAEDEDTMMTVSMDITTIICNFKNGKVSRISCTTYII